MARLREKYKKEIVPKLSKKYGYKNVMQVPRLKKIVVSMGLGSVQDNKIFDEAMNDLATITGQKPAIRRAKVSIAGFHLREGMPIGCMVTLRGKRMYEFLDRFVSHALPRIRDFRGLLKKSFDGHGGYSMGIEEHIVFPEIQTDKVQKIKGMNIAFDTSTDSDEESQELLRLFGMPFRQ
ncbi:50S ribosomal protein L5 [PVC group bacterium]|nr:50S ribosomal protein L5 [PVC group bacterium]